MTKQVKEADLDLAQSSPLGFRLDVWLLVWLFGWSVLCEVVGFYAC